MHSRLPTHITDDAVFAARNIHPAALILIRSDGTLWDSGGSWSGDGNRGGFNNPTRVTNLNNVVSASTHVLGTSVVTSDGTLWMWGRGDWGSPLRDLPDGSAVSPIRIKDNVAYASYLGHNVLRTDGSLWVWKPREVDRSISGEWVRIEGDISTIVIPPGSFGYGRRSTVIRTDGRLQILDIDRGTVSRTETIKENVVKAVLR